MICEPLLRSVLVADEPARADDGTSVQRKTTGPDHEGAEVILFTISGIR